VAEGQISKTGRGNSTVVSVKTSVAKKRKYDETANEGAGDEKRVKVRKTRRGMKAKK
jgi:hypothetical protein